MALVALVGRPNVGKSTLFNRLVARRRALEDPIPGVTRDRIYARACWRGRSFTVSDTGGMGDDPGVHRQALRAVEEAAVVVLVMDAREGLTPYDEQIAAELRRWDKPVIYVANKAERLGEEALGEFHRLGAPVLPVSARYGRNLEALRQRILELLPPEEAEEAGEAIRLAILGRPNVGKSTLFNRLVGEQRALVEPTPGTTRDPVDHPLEHAGRRFLLVDTAGVRRRARVSGRLEHAFVREALRAAERADVSLLVVDAVEGFTHQDATLASWLQRRGRACVLVANKCDLVRELRPIRPPFLQYAPVQPISALTGQGVEGLFDLAVEVWEQHGAEFPSGVVREALRRALRHHPPPGTLRISGIEQVGTHPPTFLLRCRRLEALRPSYGRFLIRFLRVALGSTGTPLRLILQEGKRRREVLA